MDFQSVVPLIPSRSEQRMRAYRSGNAKQLSGKNKVETDHLADRCRFRLNKMEDCGLIELQAHQPCKLNLTV